MNPRMATRVVLASALAFIAILFLATVSYGASATTTAVPNAPAQVTSPTKPVPFSCADSAYSRNAFLKQSQWSTTRKSLLGARVRVTGGWLDSYTGKVLKNASDVDVDHVVALAYAFRNGACSWSAAQKRAFANDTVNLLLTRDSVNVAKSDKSPAEWLPPRSVCVYETRWLAVTRKYGLTPTSKDSAVLRRCRLVK